MPIFIPAAESHLLTGQRFRSSCATSSSAPVTGVSDDVHDVHEADRVTIAPIYRCGDCRPCTTGHDELCKKVGFHGLMTDGAMAEYTVVPRNQVHHLPDSITLETRALVEPVAVAYRSVKQADVHDQSSALIYGAGPIGIGLWFALRAFGLTEVEVVEPSEHLRRSIEALGARTIHPTSVDIAPVIKYRTDGDGVDAAFDAAGSIARAATKESAHRRCQVILDRRRHVCAAPRPKPARRRRPCHPRAIPERTPPLPETGAATVAPV